MHHTEQYVEHSQVPCLGICSHQEAWEMENTEDIQMPGRNSRNSQQHRGRRRRLRQRAEGAAAAGAGAGFVGIFWSINLAILICLAHSTNAVPAVDSSTSSSSSSASSAIVTVSVTPSSLSSSSAISSTTESLLEQQQPQGQCLLDGLWVPETTARCEKQTSCRAIQRTGHCCPDYKCDCEKDGKTYANGYKLVDPDTPCRVCYCKGGEIVCSSVTCFRRDDCMPKYVPGRCCPEYDNCPILDNNPPLASDTSNSASTTAKPAPLAPPAGFNWNITIKEITKPTEIRITDDNHKVKQAIPTRKVPNTEAPTTPTAATSAVTATTAGIDAAATIESSTATVAAAAVTTEGPPASTAAAAAAGVSTAATAIDTPATPIAVLPLSQDTNQKALPVNGSSGESLKLIASVGYIDQPKPLVTYNADGLQPLAENDPSKVNIKREYTTEGVPGEALSVGAGSTYIQNGFRDALVDNVVATPELEPETAGSDNIYHIISTTEGPNSSGSTTERLVTTDGPELMSSTFGSENNTAALEISTEGLASELMASSTAQTVHHMEEDDVPQVESNPAYPSLPEDDFSLRDVNFPLVELEDIVEPESKDEQRSIATPFERDTKRTKHVTESSLDAGSGSGSGDMDVLLQALASTTENTLGQDSSSSANPGKASLSQVPLMYSAEDSSAEVRIQNVSELAKISRNQSENETSAELESGSGSGDLREPTTPRARSVSTLDIDELGSGAGQAQSPADDPKADAESLKLDEGQESNAATKEAAGLEKSFVEQAGAETGGLRLERLLLQRIY